MNNKIMLMALCILTLTQPRLAAEEWSAEAILERHIAAVGGAATIQAIENIRIELEIIEPGFRLRGDYRAAGDGRVRIDVFAEAERVFSEGVDKEGGWQQNGEGNKVELMSEAGLAAMTAGIEGNLLGLFQLLRRGHQASYLGTYSHEGVNYHRLRVIRPDGFERHYFIHPQTWMIDYTRETSALHPDINPEQKAVESHYSDYRRVCGLMRSHRTQTIELESRKEIQRSQIIGSECNLPDDELELTRPDE